jgi:hypothetical protein
LAADAGGNKCGGEHTIGVGLDIGLIAIAISWARAGDDAAAPKWGADDKGRLQKIEVASSSSNRRLLQQNLP